MRKKGILSPGESIAGYTVTAVAGSGGSGYLYRVRDISGGTFILKQIAADRMEELRSIEQYRKIPGHPGITVIHGAGKTPDGGFYYLMDAADNLRKEPEYLPDTLLNRLAERGPLKTMEVLSLAEHLGKAVQHLHRNGSGHFDIKPENVIFCSGQPKLADFGSLAPFFGRGIPRGTPGFFPEEELFSANNPGFSGKNDLYALGMTLYCAWSGRSPDEFPSLPELPDKEGMMSVRKLCLRACNPSPAYRFQTAEEFLHAVRRAQKRVQPKSPKRFLPFLLVPVLFIAVFLYFREGELTEEQKNTVLTAESTARMAEEENVLKKHLLILNAMTAEERKESRIEESVHALQQLQQFAEICRAWRKNPHSPRLKKELLRQLENCPKGFYSTPQGVGGMNRFRQRMQTLSLEEIARGNRLTDPEEQRDFSELCAQLKTTSDPTELVRIRQEIRNILSLPTPD